MGDKPAAQVLTLYFSNQHIWVIHKLALNLHCCYSELKIIDGNGGQSYCMGLLKQLRLAANCWQFPIYGIRQLSCRSGLASNFAQPVKSRSLTQSETHSGNWHIKPSFIHVLFYGGGGHDTLCNSYLHLKLATKLMTITVELCIGLILSIRKRN